MAENSVCAYRRGAVSAPLPFLQQERGFRCPQGAGMLESCNDQLIGTAEALSAPLFPSCSKRGVSLPSVAGTLESWNDQLLGIAPQHQCVTGSAKHTSMCVV